MPNVTEPMVGSGPWQDMLTRSFATGSVALQRPSGVQEQRGPILNPEHS